MFNDDNVQTVSATGMKSQQFSRFSQAFYHKCFVQLGREQLILLCTHDFISISIVPYKVKASPFYLDYTNARGDRPILC